MKEKSPVVETARKTTIRPFPLRAMALEIVGIMVLYILLSLAGIPRSVNIFITGIVGVITVGISLALTYHVSLSWFTGSQTILTHSLRITEDALRQAKEAKPQSPVSDLELQRQEQEQNITYHQQLVALQEKQLDLDAKRGHLIAETVERLVKLLPPDVDAEEKTQYIQTITKAFIPQVERKNPLSLGSLRAAQAAYLRAQEVSASLTASDDT